MTRSHDELRDLIAAVALGAADEHEVREVEAHARGCESCARDLHELRSAAGVLALAPEEVEPPAGLRERVMERVRADAAADRAAHPADAPARGRAPAAGRAPWWRAVLRPWPATAVAMAAVAGALLIWNISLQAGDDAAPAPVPVVAMAVSGTEDAPGVHGRMVYLADEDALLVRLRGLEQLPRGQAYHLWTIDGGIPRAAGVFRADASGQATVVALGAAGADAVGLTAQPHDHTAAPEGPLLLAASLSAA